MFDVQFKILEGYLGLNLRYICELHGTCNWHIYILCINSMRSGHSVNILNIKRGEPSMSDFSLMCF